MFKFIHAADIHLDSPLRGLARYEGAPVEELRVATRQALENLVQLAIDEKVTFVLIAGDLYDGDWKDHSTGLFFAKEMSRLRVAEIKVFLISGNHDALSQISKTLSLPENVQELSTTKAQTIELEDPGVAIHGRGFRKREVFDDISADYPDARAGLFNIGILHTSASGREGHEPYAPCSVDGLKAKAYDYWALGHVHTREILSDDPWIVFPGNIQGRHIRETGPKGCTLVTVEGGEIQSVEHRDLDVVRWYLCEVDAAGADDVDEVFDRVKRSVEERIEENEERLLALRIILAGRCKAHAGLTKDTRQTTSEIQNIGNDAGGGQVWIEKVRIKTQAEVDLEEALARDDAVSNLLKTIQNLSSVDAALAELDEEISALTKKLPPELQGEENPLEFDDPDSRQELLDEVKDILIPRMLAGEDAE